MTVKTGELQVGDIIVTDRTAARPHRSRVKQILSTSAGYRRVAIQPAELAGTLAGGAGHLEVVSRMPLNQTHTIERRA